MPTQDQIIEALRPVEDPELHRSIVDLGMVRTIDIGRAAQGRLGEAPAPLRRFDVIFVPKSSLAEIGQFMTSLREALPISFSYNLGNAYVN